MTEPRLVELFAGIAAFRLDLIRKAGDLAEEAAGIREAADKPRNRRREYARADHLEQLATELAQGLDRLARLADGAQDDTLVGIEVLDDDTPVRETPA